jgi:DAACS family dicarboxylate/amino acid:cation (Na+ or H+) symporter
MKTSPRLMFAGIVGGAALGIGARELALESATVADALGNLIEFGTYPIGQIFLRLLFMLAVPVVFAALVVGVGELDLASLGRVGLKAMVYTVVASGIAVLIGLTLVNLVAPGEGHEELRAIAELRAEEKKIDPPDKSGIELLITMVPDNPVKAAAGGDMMGLMVFALIFGVGLAQVRTPGASRLRETIGGLHDVTMRLLEWVIRLAPLGVGALLFTTFGTLGVGALAGIGAFVAVVLGALAIHLIGTYSFMLVTFARRSPLGFFAAVRVPMQTAFATSSSSATLPLSLECAENELRLPRRIGRFVLTAGAAMNQNGTALFEGVTVLFLAQVFGVDLTLGEQALVMVICILGGIGTAGVPGGSLPIIAMILASFEIPVIGLALILGVDRLLDMCRTTVNVVGDLVIACCVARGEREAAPTPRGPEDAAVLEAPKADG